MSGTPYSEANRAVLAWGSQRPVPDLGPTGDGSTNTKEKRQLSDFYGVDEPSFNSFVYAQNNPSIPAPSSTRSVMGLTRPAQRSISQYDRTHGRPRVRTRRQPATMPAASFAEIAASDAVVDRQGNPLPAPKTITRSDSLLNRARRVLSLPSGRRSRRFATGNGTPPTPPQHDLFERRPERAENVGRSHLSHSSRRTAASRVQAAREANPTGALEERIKALEAELAIQKKRNEEQQQRLEELEKEVARKDEALPALESIIQTAMKTFEAKENALKRTITTLDRDFTNAMAEKNETIRLYDGYDDRHRPNRASPSPSPPVSISTVSESEGSGYHLQVSRRIQSLDAHRRSGSPSSRSLFTNIEFDINR